ncbi:hypothetical protein DM01DRAFT_1345660 [Hesseltinella vesiculosa]|uniref:Uncharacterized protein n=1 Tax=Hesseltinella vesiculosa TaxID=101127 RepID=A0A1X2GIA4_9FUNG|nr:hypothetical protein DM01DRAFT_1345660 [Hesseltinella vesiculosa]
MIDNAAGSRRRAEALEKSIHLADAQLAVDIRDIARSPGVHSFVPCQPPHIESHEIDAAMDQTCAEDVFVEDIDAIVFASGGALSLYEKHHRTLNSQSPLASKDVGLMMSSDSQFEPDFDDHVVHCLSKYGFTNEPIILDATDELNLEIEGQRFVNAIEHR